MADKKLLYKGVHLFTPDGVKLFQEDYWLASAYFIKKLFLNERNLNRQAGISEDGV